MNKFDFSNLKVQKEVFKFGDVIPITTCVYSIKNIQCNKVYIGVTKDLRKRISRHLSYLRANNHPNKYMQEDFTNIGESSFEVSVVVNLDQISLEEETLWINKYQKEGTSYNYTIEEKNERRSWTWEDYPESKKKMIKSLKVAKRKYNFEQYDKEGNLIETWGSVEEIIKANPDYKWQNIYSVCNGYKKTYKGFVWKKILKI